MIQQNRNDYRIVVYTDRPDRVPAHDLIKRVHEMPKKLAGWRGPGRPTCVNTTGQSLVIDAGLARPLFEGLGAGFCPRPSTVAILFA